MWTMKEYIQRRQATIVEYIDSYPIYEICIREERVQGSRRFLWWWYKYLNHEEDGYGTSKRVEREVGRHGKYFSLK